MLDMHRHSIPWHTACYPESVPNNCEGTHVSLVVLLRSLRWCFLQHRDDFSRRGPLGRVAPQARVDDGGHLQRALGRPRVAPLAARRHLLRRG